MRAVLLPHKIGQRRRSRRARSERWPVRAAAPARAATETTEPAYTADVAPETGASIMPGLARAADASGPAADACGPVADAAACRVRAAGGPLDSASYTCGCGCVFAAAVTTTVACPHCGDAQAW